MSFPAVCNYLIEYSKSKRDALNNKKGLRWFTDKVGALSQFQTSIFSRTGERAAWTAQYVSSLTAGKGIMFNRMMKEEMKVELLSGWYRDIRILMCTDSSCRVRNAYDYERFEFMRSYYRDRKINALQEGLK